MGWYWLHRRDAGQNSKGLISRSVCLEAGGPSAGGEAEETGWKVVVEALI